MIWSGLKRSEKEFLYYCEKCDEALVLAPQEIDPRKIILVFANKCPGCSFSLEDNLKQTLFRTEGAKTETVYANESCLDFDIDILLEEAVSFTVNRVKSSDLEHTSENNLTTEKDLAEHALSLLAGQLVSLQGRESNNIALHLCVKATLPKPEGLDSNAIFLDVGNMFDSYRINYWARTFGLEPKNAQQSIHLSRAFTHHQVDSLISHLAEDITNYNAKLAIISDITLLYCDPDVTDFEESFDLFRKDVRILRETAEKRDALIIATALKPRNEMMENFILQTSHLSQLTS